MQYTETTFDVDSRVDSVGLDSGRAWSTRFFWPILAALLALGIARSWIATRLDAFTMDEGWHLVAGVSYTRLGDFRLNPEHPPLVKLWVGPWMSEHFTLPPLRPLRDKAGERLYINEALYVLNDIDRIQAQARVAMTALHALLIAALAWCLRRAFSSTLALVATALLLIDPSVAANLPLVMTDLSMALLAACSVLSCHAALTKLKPFDIALTALSLGLTLATKHSALIAVFAVLSVAAMQLLKAWRAPGRGAVRKQGAALLVIGLGAYLVLWGCYGFRYRETTAATAHIGWEVTRDGKTEISAYNRPLGDKITDLRSTGMQPWLRFAVEHRLLPRSYLWGLADTLRTGFDGRYETLYVFGHYSEGNRTPWYFFPAIVAAKLPLGMLALALFGWWLVWRRHVPRAWTGPLAALGMLALEDLVFLMRGHSGYAGIRHALAVLPAIGVLAALPCLLVLRRFNSFAAFASRELGVLTALGATAMLATLSVLPVQRPWEYYNALAGGTADAWRYFTDDGVDMRQRTRELAGYYHEHLRGTSENVYEFYDIPREESQARKLSLADLYAGADDSTLVSGTFLVNARWLLPRPLYDLATLRESKPVARMGNLMVYRGQYEFPWLPAERCRAAAWSALNADSPDGARAERMFERVLELYPVDYGSALELGNLRLTRGDANAALAAYTHAHAHISPRDPLRLKLSEHIAALKRGDSAGLKPIRNPWLE